MMPGLDPERVVSVYSASRGTRGSGYLLRPNIVLTAAHCVGETGDLVEVRPLRRTGSSSFTLADGLSFTVLARASSGEGSPSRDLALLKATDADAVDASSRTAAWAAVVPRLGRISGTGSLTATALAFPLHQESAGAINIEYIRGEIQLLDSAREVEGSRLLDLQIPGGTPRYDRFRESPWAGTSGAAVFCGQHLVGVIVQ